MKMQERQAKRLLQTTIGSYELPRYKRNNRDPGSSSTVYAFRFKRSPDWVVIGKGWVGNLSEIEFIERYAPSNAAARKMFDSALARATPEALAMYEARVVHTNYSN